MSGVDLSRFKSSRKPEVSAVAALSSDVKDSYSSEAGGNCRKKTGTLWSEFEKKRRS